MIASPPRPRHRQEPGIAAAGRLAHRGTPDGASLSFATTTHLWPLPDPPSQKPPQRNQPHWRPPDQFRAAPLPRQCRVPPSGSRDRTPTSDLNIRTWHTLSPRRRYARRTQPRQAGPSRAKQGQAGPSRAKQGQAGPSRAKEGQRAESWSLHPDEVMLERVPHRTRPVRHTELAVDVRQVELDGVLTDPHLATDRGRREAGGDRAED